MLSYDEIREVVKSKLTEKRFYHSECVAARAVEYAKIYGVDEEKARIAGICHDIAKDIPKEDRIKLAEEDGVELDEFEKENTSLIHGKHGAIIAKRDFGCTDDICQAIKWHTTGHENMTMLDKIIFMADATGEDRHYSNTEELYELTKTDIDKAMIELIKVSLIDVMEHEKILHPESIKTYNYLIKNR